MLSLSDYIDKVIYFISSDQRFISVEIERDAPINTDVNRMPWIGVYRKSRALSPSKLGASICESWNGSLELGFVIQAYGYSQNGKDAADELDVIVTNLLSLFNTIKSKTELRTRVVGITCEYSYSQQTAKSMSDSASSVFFPECLLLLQVETR